MHRYLFIAALGAAALLSAAEQQQFLPDQQFWEESTLEKKISDIFASQLVSRGLNTVSFEVAEGKVNLQGTVDTAETKQKIEELIRRLPGVSEVENQLVTIEKPSPPAGQQSAASAEEGEKEKKNGIRARFPQDQGKSDSDKAINDKIRSKLSVWFIHLYHGIALDTADGVVTLKGFVTRKEDVQKIHERIEKVAGVKEIKSELSVKVK